MAVGNPPCTVTREAVDLKARRVKRGESLLLLRTLALVALIVPGMSVVIDVHSVLIVVVVSVVQPNYFLTQNTIDGLEPSFYNP